MSDPSHDVTDPASPPAYVFKPALMAAPWEFTLRDDGLEWRYGAREGVVPYGAITRVRMAYRPTSTQSHRFMTDIWSDAAPRLSIASTTWRSMMDQARQDNDYRAFVTALHQRLVVAGSRASGVAGLNALLFALGAIAVAGVTTGLVVLGIRAAMEPQWTAAAATLAFTVLFGWHAGRHLWRNRPRRYPLAQPPTDLLP